MATKVEIILQGEDKASGPIKATTGALQELDSAAGNAGGTFGRLGGIMQTALGFVTGGAIAAGLGAIKDSIGGVISGMVGGNAEFERYQVQFTTLLGSADAAKQRLDELTKFAATTPFELPEVVRADKILQSFGLESEAAAQKFGFNAQQIRTIAGDVAAGTGAGFEEMSLLLGKFSSGATGEALARMAELGITTREELSKMGVQFSKSGELMSPLPVAMNAVLKTMQGKFGGLMDAQSQTFEGMVSNLQDWVGQTERAIGKPIFDVLKGSLGGLLGFLGSDAVKGAIDGFANGIASGLQSAIDGLTSFGASIMPMVQNVGFYAQALLAAAQGEETFGAVLGPVGDVIDTVVSRISEFITAFQTAGEWSSSTGETIARLVEILLGLNTFSLDGLEGTFNAAAGIVSGAIENIKGRVQAALSGVQNMLSGNVGLAYGDWLKVFGLPEGLANDIGGKIQAVVNEVKSRVQAAIAGFQSGLTAGVGVATINFLAALGIPDDMAGQIGAKVAQIPTAIETAKTSIQNAIAGFKAGISAGLGVATINVLTALGVPEDTAVQIGQRIAGIIQSVNEARTRLQGALDAFKSGVSTGGVAGGASAFLSALGLDPSIVTTVQSVAGQIATAVTGAISTIRNAIAGFQSGGTSGLLSALGIAPAPIQQAIGIVLQLFNRLKDGISGFFAEVAPAAEPLKQLLNDLAPLVEPGLNALRTLAAFVGGALAVAFAGFVGFVGGALPGLGQIVRGAVEVITGALELVIGAVRTVGSVVAALISGDWAGAWQAAQDGVRLMVDGVQNLLNGLKDIAVGAIRAMLDGLVSMLTGGKMDAAQAAQAIVDGVMDTLNGIAERARDSGRRLIESFADGIRNSIQAARDAISAAVSAVDQYLPHSDAQTGPLSQLTASGAALFTTWAGGVESGAGQALSVVQAALGSIAKAISGGDAAQAMNELASMFRAIFNSFSDASNGIGGNAQNHVRRLITSITEISDSIGDFLKALKALDDFAGTAAANVVMSQSGKDGLIGLFWNIAQLAQAMARAARDAAAYFINSEVGAALQGLASALLGIKTLTENTVGVVKSLLDNVAGGGMEQILNSAAAEQWLTNLIGGIVMLMRMFIERANEAVGQVQAAGAGLTNLGAAVQPLTNTVTAYTSIVTALLTQVGGTGLEAVLNSADAQQWLANLIGGIVMLCMMLVGAAQNAAGKIPPASDSLTNLGNALQPLTTVIDSTVKIVEDLNSVIGNSVVKGALTGPMAETWDALYQFIAGKLVTFAAGIKIAAEAAAGQIPPASTALQNLAGVLQPLTTVIDSSFKIISDLHSILNNSVIKGATVGPMAETWQALYQFIAVGLVGFAIGIKNAVEGALGTIPEASKALQNLSGAVQPILTVIEGTVKLITDLRDWLKAPIPLSQDMQTQARTLAENLKTLWPIIRDALSGAAPTEEQTKPAQAWAGTVGIITAVAGLMDFLKKLSEFTKEPVTLSQDMRDKFKVLGENLKLLWADLGAAINGATAPTDEALKAAQAWSSTTGPITGLAGLMDFLKKLHDFTKEPTDLSQDMRSRFVILGQNLKLLWADLETALANATPPTDEALKAAQAWTSAASPITGLAGLADFLKKLSEFTKEPTDLSQDMRSRFITLGQNLELLWADLGTALGNATPPTDEALKAAQAWSSATGPITGLAGLMDFLKKLKDFTDEPITLSQGMRDNFVTLGENLKSLWADLTTALGNALPPTDEALKAAQAWASAAGPVTGLAGLMDFLKKLSEFTKEPTYLSGLMRAQFYTLGIELQLLWADLELALGEATPPTEGALKAAQAWSSAAGPITGLAGLMDFLKKLYDFAKEPVILSGLMRAQFYTLGVELQLLWIDFETALGDATPPTDAALKAAQQWSSAASPVTGLGGLMDFLKKLKDWTKEPVFLSQEMRNEFQTLGTNLKSLWADLTTALGTDAGPTEAEQKIAETWNKAAGLLSPLSTVMDTLKKLDEWMKAPIAYTGKMRGQVQALFAALVSIVQDFIAAATDPTLTQELTAEAQKAAEALSTTFGKAFDAIGKAMDLIAKLSSGDLITGQGAAWVNMHSNATASGWLPLDQAVQPFINSIVAVVKAMGDAAANIDTSGATAFSTAVGPALDTLNSIITMVSNLGGGATAGGGAAAGGPLASLQLLAQGIVAFFSDLATVKTGAADAVRQALAGIITALQSAAGSFSLTIAVKGDLTQLMQQLAGFVVEAILVPLKGDLEMLTDQLLAYKPPVVLVPMKFYRVGAGEGDGTAPGGDAPPDTPTEGRRASGGPVLGSMPYIVGERGPELFVPGASGTIIPNDKLGGNTTNININVNLATSAGLPGTLAMISNMAKAV